MKRTLSGMGTLVFFCGLTFSQKPAADARLEKESLISKLEALKGGLMGPGAAQLGLMGAVVKGAPYAAEAVTETTQTLADGTHIHRKESYTIYRDGEGRLRRESANAIWISDPVASVSYVLDPKNQTARKMPLARSVASAKMAMEKAHLEAEIFAVKAAGGAHDSGQQSHAIREPLQHQLEHRAVAHTEHENARQTAVTIPIWKKKLPEKKDSLGKQVMEGVEVEGTRTSAVIAEGEIGNDRPIQIVSERWYSPELQAPVMTRHSDPRTGETVYRLIAIRRGEPGVTLFEVPAGYRIVPAKDLPGESRTK